MRPTVNFIRVVAVLGTLRRLKLEPILSNSSRRNRGLTVAMVVARIIDPALQAGNREKSGYSNGYHYLG